VGEFASLFPPFPPFPPMLPIQVLTNNLLYDFSRTAIPTDNVDEDYLAAPRKRDIGNISNRIGSSTPMDRKRSKPPRCF
jgi:hypothetical protein